MGADSTLEGLWGLSRRYGRSQLLTQMRFAEGIADKIGNWFKSHLSGVRAESGSRITRFAPDPIQ
jgi:hypothetical protein